MVVDVIILSAVLAASSQRCGAGKHVFSIIGSGSGICVVVGGEKEPKLLYSATLEDAIAKDLGLIPDVRLVCVDRADNNLLVWVALDNPRAENREKVFRKQFELIDGFPEISFDFNIVSSDAKNPREFASDAKVVYSRP